MPRKKKSARSGPKETPAAEAPQLPNTPQGRKSRNQSGYQQRQKQKTARSVSPSPPVLVEKLQPGKIPIALPTVFSRTTGSVKTEVTDVPCIEMSDSENFMARAFPVAHLLKDDDSPLNLDEPPSDAIQYLRRVALEASKLDDVVVAQIDEAKVKKQTVVYQREEKPTSSWAPSREWKICQVSDFSNVRVELAKVRMGQVKPPPVQLPETDNEISWCLFCFGTSFANEIVEVAEGRLRPINNTVPVVQGTPPLLTVLCAMDQSTVEQVLEFHTEWLACRKNYTMDQGRWLYSLLARLELPLTPDVCSQLRTLARACSVKRDKICSEDEKYPGREALMSSLNLFICLVSTYFRQLDLEDL